VATLVAADENVTNSEPTKHENIRAFLGIYFEVLSAQESVKLLSLNRVVGRRAVQICGISLNSSIPVLD